MRGRFTPGAGTDEWCERRLLSRIHHYTLKRLRAEVEPVAARDFLRFLFSWQHVTADTRMAGPKALDAIVAQLEGFEAAAGAWESEILPTRIADYDGSWLDDRCLAGHIAWMRLRPRNAKSNGQTKPAPVRSSPITLLPRRSAGIWASLAGKSFPCLSPRAQLLADSIKQHGASFFDELMETTGLLRSQVEEALAELVAHGIVTSDSFDGLRALLIRSSGRRTGARRRRRSQAIGMEGGGRWALVRRSLAPKHKEQSVEHVARTLLARYGVVFWRLLEREAAWLPPWRELLQAYRRLESRGEIRGGRFVAGFSGEQFALPEAIGLLRAIRKQGAIRPSGIDFGRGSAESGRDSYARPEATRSCRESGSLSKWNSDCSARCGRCAVYGKPSEVDGVDNSKCIVERGPRDRLGFYRSGCSRARC